MKRAGIWISGPTQTASANFEMSESSCEVLTASLLNREVLDLMAHATQVNEVIEEWRKRVVDR